MSAVGVNPAQGGRLSIAVGQVPLISPEESMLHELDATASFMRKHLNGKRTIEEIAGLLAQQFEVRVDQALADTNELVAPL